MLSQVRRSVRPLELLRVFPAVEPQQEWFGWDFGLVSHGTHEYCRVLRLTLAENGPHVGSLEVPFFSVAGESRLESQPAPAYRLENDDLCLPYTFHSRSKVTRCARLCAPRYFLLPLIPLMTRPLLSVTLQLPLTHDLLLFEVLSDVSECLSW